MSAKYLFAEAPRRVYWEITRACDLACQHCRAKAAPCADPSELDTAAGLKLLKQLSTAEPKPHVILSGGDPLKRADLWQLIKYAQELGMGVAVSPSATPLLTDEAIDALRAADVEAISLSIDGSTAERHDSFRGIPGCLERTMRAARRAHEVGLAFQVNTLVSAETLDDMPAIAKLVREVGATRWSLFFLVTVGRGVVLQPITAEQSETLLQWLAEQAKLPGPVITTTEAPHFRRVAMASLRAENHSGASHGGPEGAAPKQAPVGHGAGMRDGNGVMFIGHDGEVAPSGFLPVSVGNVKMQNPLTLYRETPLFQALRAVDGFHGRCGRCEFRHVCGGSRARAYVATGDALAEDPLCPYQPAAREHTAQATPSAAPPHP